MRRIPAGWQRAMLALAGAVLVAGAAQATGIQPESTILVVSEKDGEGQIAVQNTDDLPVLLNVVVRDLPGDDGISIFATPAVSRIEARGRQVVRFMLEKPETPLTVQHIKRVSFEGIPGEPLTSSPDTRTRFRINVRHDIPAIISPAGLVQDNEPWKLLVIHRGDGGSMFLSNPSPFVVRMQPDLRDARGDQDTLQPLERSYLLPHEKVELRPRADRSTQTLTAVRIRPASPWGYGAPQHDIPVVSPAH